ncbi:MAG: DUF349 domain-containing protein [Bacteroidetes bacterium]|nr:DUF349 domain-containing protein [Bacteroidota bacterium]
MENTENTPNPGPVEDTAREENSSSAVIAEPININPLPTESDQTEKVITEEFHTELVEPLAGNQEEHLEELVAEHEEEEHLEELAAEHESHETQVNYDQMSRAELVDLLEKVVKEDDINVIKTRIALIKVAFLKKKKEESLTKYEAALGAEGEAKEGEVKEELPAEQDELDTKFNEIFNIYKANKARYIEEQEKLKNENLKRKLQIIEDLKQLIGSEETLKKTYDEFKALQERWKNVGMVPRGEINNLWQNYHFLVEKFFEKVKVNKELKDLDLKKNFEAKMALCEKTEELLLETSILKSFKKLQKYHEEWKEIGPAPADKKDDIWERFKNATDKINERRREHYTRIEDEQGKNLETKTALCEQAEEVLTSKNETIKEWQEQTNKVNELMNIWKSIGPVPQKVNADIWTRFKTSLDAFFSNKKEFFDKLKDQQLHNYNLKVELCMQAESLKANTDWKKTSQEMIRLQGEWKKIGPVPKKHSDKIWKRFRAACDEFFNAKSSYFSNVQSHEEENLSKKNDLLKRLNEYEFSEDKNANLEILKNFQREWSEIGHIPIKEKDRLQNEFRAVVNKHLDHLKISEIEISTLNYQNRMDHLKNDPNARRVIGREKELLINKISKIKEDVNLWENNIGFLAKSKNAAILREEFENKINKTKSELKVLEAKLKILKQQQV